MYVLEVRNAELIESLTRQAAELGITNAAIVALIGAIDSFTRPPTRQAMPPRTLFQLPAASGDDRHRRDRRRQAPHPCRDGRPRRPNHRWPSAQGTPPHLLLPAPT